MVMYGYGEDSFTLFVLKQNISSFLKQLKATSKAEDLKIFYRPSFGRGKNIGEYDAIVITKDVVYLVEAKRENSAEYKSGTINLSKSQLRRHLITKDILIEWIRFKSSVNNWDAFRSSFRSIFKTNHGYNLPPSNSDLAKNLMFISQHIKKAIFENVLLFISIDSAKKLNSSPVMCGSIPVNFEKVEFFVPSSGGTGFVKLY